MDATYPYKNAKLPWKELRAAFFISIKQLKNLSDLYSSLKNDGTLTALCAGGSAASSPMLTTVSMTGIKSLARIAMG